MERNGRQRRGRIAVVENNLRRMITRGHGCQTFARADSLATGPVRVRSSTSGKPLHPLMALGTFAEYITVPAAQVAKLPPNSPLDVLSPIGCAVLTGWGAARAVAGVEIGHRYYLARS